MEEKILSILQEIRPEVDFSDSTDFIEDGYLDSFDVMTLITELEDEFGVLVEPLSVIPENFASVDSLKKLIENSTKK